MNRRGSGSAFSRPDSLFDAGLAESQVLAHMKRLASMNKVFKSFIGMGYYNMLVSAIAFCHARGVFHRDLKPENLLLDDQSDLKISGFGLSAVVSPAAGDRLFQTFCGTPVFAALEVLSMRVYDGAMADIWPSGVILLNLTAGYPPFNDPNLTNLCPEIAAGCRLLRRRAPSPRGARDQHPPDLAQDSLLLTLSVLLSFH